MASQSHLPSILSFRRLSQPPRGLLQFRSLHHIRGSARTTSLLHANRLYSSATRNTTGSSLGSGTLLLGASIASALAGYLFATQHRKPCSLDISESPSFGSPDDFTKAIWELQRAFPVAGIVSTSPHDLLTHGFSDNDYHPGSPHSVIVFPESTDDVVKIVKIATKYRMPVVPYSGATSLEGHFRAVCQTYTHHKAGGICVDLMRMDRILEIHEDDSDVVCQPGVGWLELNETLKRQGIPLFFPIDPGPGATLGGMLSTGCSGTNAVRYGTAKGEWFLNATVVLPSGKVIKTRRRSRKSAAGFDLTKLFIGAEGTLGIITEVTVRLTPVLPTNVAVVHFPDVHSATAASIDIINQGIGIQCVEIVDSVAMKATNNYGKSVRKWPEKDSLYFKFQGQSPASLKETADITQRICAKHGGTGFSLARHQEEADALWLDRKNMYFSGLSLVPGAQAITTDVCVPVSKLPQLIQESQEDLAKLGLVTGMAGHVGDGNFHALILFTTDEEFERAKQATDRIVHRAIELDGTCTGEHGIGIGKKEYLVKELGEGTVELMNTIKHAVDPLGLFNPGKLYPDPPSKKREP
ncbi:hypothetical protein HYPSUDRAFT_136362 [Hypholoma sublateritium FD-334 SS-4]|uniref:D-lactate dehydrogenase (cytochrome) n=1 Tax=Hypholoma sublateritium (strain FD-334 SS-4) TaxID=945553 RepID=A0A0D2P0E1_HYPSF|nr:hypothetical protein HYPSUDRAFT_136362 [Hypholoma sublateritium FD-334 SS-4]